MSSAIGTRTLARAVAIVRAHVVTPSVAATAVSALPLHVTSTTAVVPSYVAAATVNIPTHTTRCIAKSAQAAQATHVTARVSVISLFHGNRPPFRRRKTAYPVLQTWFRGASPCSYRRRHQTPGEARRPPPKFPAPRQSHTRACRPHGHNRTFHSPATDSSVAPCPHRTVPVRATHHNRNRRPWQEDAPARHHRPAPVGSDLASHSNQFLLPRRISPQYKICAGVEKCQSKTNEV